MLFPDRLDGDVLEIGAISAAITAVWILVVRIRTGVVRPVIHQFSSFIAQQERLINAVEIELPKVTRAINDLAGVINDHEGRILSLEHPSHPDAAPISGASPLPFPIPMTQRETE